MAFSRVIAIDGPAGSGKSTVAAKLAKKLGSIHLNSGALFRAVGIRAKELGILPGDGAALSELARTLNFEFRLEPDSTTHFFVDGECWDNRVRTLEAGELGSRIAVLGDLRAELVAVQHRIAEAHEVVLEGRDAGTVVFPETPWKFYLDAPSTVRAARRHAEVVALLGESAPQLEQVLREVQERDLRDSTRAVAPQVRAADAELIDTSEMTAEEVVDVIASRIRGRSGL